MADKPKVIPKATDKAPKTFVKGHCTSITTKAGQETAAKWINSLPK